MEEEYLILQCPACERSVKIKSDAAGTRMGCPYCKEPIDVAETYSEEVAPDEAEDPVDEPPLVFRRISDTDTDSDRPEPAGEARDPDNPQGKRRKHRKHQGEALDWDQDKTAKKTAESASDDDSSQFLEMDPDSPGGVRMKKVRRKKILTAKDKFLRAITATVFVAAAAIAGFIIYSAVMQTSKVINTEKRTLQELPPEIGRLIEEAKKTPITDELTLAEEEIAASVLSGFLNAKTIDERLRFVRDQERVGPIMEKWYADNPEEASKEWPDAEILLRKKIIDDGRHFIILAVEFVGIGKRVLAIEQAMDGEMRLDWETTVGYQPIPLEQFKETRPTIPIKFWVKLKPSDYYNFQFSDQKKYQAVELSYPGRIDFNLTGYIDKSKEWAPALIERLDSGEAPSLIVDIAYPQVEVTDDSLVEIIAIRSETWFP